MSLFTQQKRTLLLTTAIALSIGVGAAFGQTDITAKFADENFRAAVYKKIGKKPPAPILDADVKTITSLDVSYRPISSPGRITSLAGIEHFAALTELFCENNRLAALDLSNNPALTTLLCYNNELTALDVSKNAALTGLACFDNKLTALDVSKNAKLSALQCGGNKLTALDLSNNPALTTLNASGNELAALDVSKNPALTYLNLNDNPIEDTTAVTGIGAERASAVNFTFAPRSAPPPAEPVTASAASAAPLTSVSLPAVSATPAAPAPQPADAATGKSMVAVYMAGKEPFGAKGAHNVIGGELAKAISNSEKYIAVDRTEAIVSALEKEHVFQRSGAVNEDQIKELGRQFGARYLCIAEISALQSSTFYLDARLVDVVTAEIVNTVTANSNLKGSAEMVALSQRVSRELIDPETYRREQAEIRAKKRATFYKGVGVDIVGVGAFAYGLYQNYAASKLIDDGKYKSAEDAVRIRDVGYIVGAAALASGISIHIFF